MTDIVFIPGLLCDEELFAAQIGALKAKGHACHVYVPSFADNMQWLARDILEKAPQQFSLVALSMGGYVAFEMLRQAPDRITKLVMMNTQARADTQEHKNRRMALVELSQTGRFKGVTPRLLPRLINEKHLQDTAITQVIFDMAARIGQEVFVKQQMAIMNRIDSRPLLTAITQPTLVIGGMDDQLIARDALEELGHTIPNASLHVLDDCGHLSPLEQPEQVNQLLADFLA